MEKRTNQTQTMTNVLAQKVFSNPKITAQFISDILELPVHKVKLLNPFENLDHNKASITALVQLTNESEMIIEIQIVEEVNINESYYLYLSNYFTKNKQLFEAKELNPMYFVNEVLPFYTIYITQKSATKTNVIISTFVSIQHKHPTEKSTSQAKKVLF